MATAILKTKMEHQKVKAILDNPVKWAQMFVTIFDNSKKEMTPWVARWYQSEMMCDKSYKKVYRCGRRTGKSETMIVEALHKAHTNKYFRILIVTPYENQVRLIFMRMNEILNESPLLKSQIVKNTKNPYHIEFNNGSAILGFTTGASSGSNGASIRGQRADWIYLDEVDYMGAGDFDAVMAIAGEREDIGITMSSTPTGRRSHFYECCVDPKRGFIEHFHPSTHNPNWSIKMEAEFRAMLSEQGYVHEILAEFGTQDTGVFDKNKVDAALNRRYYAYNELDYYQQVRADMTKKEQNIDVEMFMYDEYHPAPFNPLRCMGVDFDKYGASSSILILDYDVKMKKFMVMKRIEVPRSEYSYDATVNLIVKLNTIYNPSWIYCDSGSGEYQIERLHIYGDEHPESGLKNKVVRRNFKQSLEITDPITYEVEKKPLKLFMVNQLQVAFERDLLVLSPFDEVLHKQLIDYEVVKRTGVTNDPVFTSVNEHFVDALGLAYLAFVLEFNELIDMVRDTTVGTIVGTIQNVFAKKALNDLFSQTEKQSQNYAKSIYSDPFQDEPFARTLVPMPTHNGSPVSTYNWGSRSGGARKSSRSSSRRSSW